MYVFGGSKLKSEKETHLVGPVVVIAPVVTMAPAVVMALDASVVRSFDGEGSSGAQLGGDGLRWGASSSFEPSNHRCYPALVVMDSVLRSFGS